MGKIINWKKRKQEERTHTHKQASTSTKRGKKRECWIVFLRRTDGRLSLDYRCRFAQKEPKKDTSKSSVRRLGIRTAELTNKLEPHVRTREAFNVFSLAISLNPIFVCEGHFEPHVRTREAFYVFSLVISLNPIIVCEGHFRFCHLTHTHLLLCAAFPQSLGGTTICLSCDQRFFF